MTFSSPKRLLIGFMLVDPSAAAMAEDHVNGHTPPALVDDSAVSGAQPDHGGE